MALATSSFTTRVSKPLARGTRARRSLTLLQRRSNGNLGYLVNSSLVNRGAAPLDATNEIYLLRKWAVSSAFRFPAQVEPNGDGGYIASFRDIPEALTEAATMEELKVNALDALITAIDFYIEDQRPFPKPSEAHPEDLIVELPPSVIVKILLLNAMVDTNTRPVDLAKKMGITRQEVNRITDLHHATKIDTVARALYALNRQLDISVSAV